MVHNTANTQYYQRTPNGFINTDRPLKCTYNKQNQSFSISMASHPPTESSDNRPTHTSHMWHVWKYRTLIADAELHTKWLTMCSVANWHENAVAVGARNCRKSVAIRSVCRRCVEPETVHNAFAITVNLQQRRCRFTDRLQVWFLDFVVVDSSLSLSLSSRATCTSSPSAVICWQTQQQQR